MSSVVLPVADNKTPQVAVALLAVYLIWGSTYLALRWAVAEMPPFFLAGSRYFAAGLLLFALGRLRGEPWPTAAGWKAALPVGILLFPISNGFVAVASQSLSSGVTAVTCATMPLWMAALTSFRGTRLGVSEWAGLLIGFAGVAVLGSAEFGGDPVAALVLLCAPLAWAVGSLYQKGSAIPGGAIGTAMPTLIGGALCGLVSVGLREEVHLDLSARAWLSQLYLTLAGSVVGFSAFTWLLRNTRPALATSYAYVNPVVAVLLGAWLASEPLGLAQVGGLSLVVAGVVLILRAR